MNFRRIRAIARKEFLHVLRDPRSLLLAIGIPVLMLVLFGYALTLDVDNVPLVVLDQSGTPASRDLVSRFSGSRYFSLRRFVDNEREAVRAIDRGEVMAALVIPRTFAQDVAGGRTAPRATAHRRQRLEHRHAGHRLCPIADRRVLAGDDRPAASSGWRVRTWRHRWTCGRGSGSTPTWSRGTTSFPA